MDDQPPSQLNGDERYWSALGRSAGVLAGCAVLTFVLLLVAKPLAVIMIPVMFVVPVVGVLRAGRARSSTKAPQKRGEVTDWRNDPSIELWRNHPGVAITCTAFAVFSTALLIYLRTHH